MIGAEREGEALWEKAGCELQTVHGAAGGLMNTLTAQLVGKPETQSTLSSRPQGPHCRGAPLSASARRNVALLPVFPGSSEAREGQSDASALGIYSGAQLGDHFCLRA